MRNAAPPPEVQAVPANLDADLDAETEVLRGDEPSDESPLDSDVSEGDPIPRNFLGEVDRPAHDDVSSTCSSDVPHSQFIVRYECGSECHE